MEIRELTCTELDELLKLVRRSQWPTPRLGRLKLQIVRKEDKP